jgi:hypothetical protein
MFHFSSANHTFQNHLDTPLRQVTVNVARFLIEQVDKYQCLQTGNSTAHQSSNADQDLNDNALLNTNSSFSMPF